SGKGSKTYVNKRLYLDLIHDGRLPDAEGEIYYNFDFYDYVPIISQNSYWFEVGRILNVVPDTGIDGLIGRHIKSMRDVRSLPSSDAAIVEHNLRRLYESIWIDEALS